MYYLIIKFIKKKKLFDYIASQGLKFEFKKTDEGIKSDEFAKLSKIIHKIDIDIDINEKLKKDESFRCCNEEFIFIIHENKHKNILGMGKYTK